MVIHSFLVAYATIVAILLLWLGQSPDVITRNSIEVFMSAFVCSENTFETIYNGLHQFHLDHHYKSKEVIDRMIATSSKDSKPGDDVYLEVIKNLYAVNVDAVNQRYGETREAKISEEKLKEISYLIAIVSPYQFVKSLECLHYQMSEGTVPMKSELYKMVTELINAVCRDIVTESPLYETANWD